jgi:diguanylate cyclase (GGDEF)-like protein/PAS domain S-box-containing protein
MKKIYFIFYIFFIILFIFLILRNVRDGYFSIVELSKHNIHSSRTESLTIVFNEFYKKYDIIFQNLIANDKIIDLMEQANNQDLATQNLIRDEIFNTLNSTYINLSINQILEDIHFYLPKGISFFKMSDKNSLQEDLKNIRFSVVEVQNHNKIIRTIEKSLNKLYFISIYPILKNGNLVGSVEIKTNFEQIRENVENNLGEYIAFIFFENAKNFINANEESFFSKKFYQLAKEREILDKYSHINLKKPFLHISQKLKNSASFQDKLEQNLSFYEYEEYKDQKYFLSFFPLKDFKRENLGYMVFTTSENKFSPIQYMFKEKIIFVLFIMTLIIIIIYILLRKLIKISKTEDILKIKNSTFVKLEEISDLAVIIYNLNKKTISMNNQAKQIFKIKENVIDEPAEKYKWLLQKFSRGNFRVLREFVKVIHGKNADKFTCAISRDSDELSIEGKAKLDIDGNEKILYIIFKDVTVEKRYQIKIENLLEIIDENVVISKTDLNGLITFASQKFIEISGYSKNELIGHKHDLIRSKDTPQSFYESLWITVLEGKEFHGIVKNMAKNGHEFWLEKSITPEIKNGKVVGFTDISYDMTARIKFEELSKAIQTIFNAQSTMIIMIRKREVVMANRKFLEFVGYETIDDFNKKVPTIAKLFIQSVEHFSTPENFDTKDCIHKLIADNHDKDVTVKMHNNFKNIDEVFNVDVSFIHDNYMIAYILSFINITGLFQESSAYKYQATHDLLTDTYNKSYFNNIVQHYISNFHRYDEFFSVIIFDIDYFKRVNDTYGHLIGDSTLITLATVVKTLIRDSDIFARWGGEEFVILATHTKLVQAIQIAEKIRTSVEITEFVGVGNISISCGVSEILKNDYIDILMKRADDALYRAKRGGRNRVEAN